MDVEKTRSKLTIWIKNKMYEYLDKEESKEVVGLIRMTAFERGKKVLDRNLRNIWTIEGRSYSAMIKAYASYGPDTPKRTDKIKYIGVGSGTTPEVSTVPRLVTPVAWNAGGDFLATLDIPSFNVDNTQVTFSRTFGLNEISIAGTVTVSEIGIFTDGVAPTYIPGTRLVTLAAASAQVPMGYKTFEPFNKTTDTVLRFDYSLSHN